MAPINYDKWNKAVDADGDDDDEDDRPPGRPRVTRLEGGSKITIGAREPAAADAGPFSLSDSFLWLRPPRCPNRLFHLCFILSEADHQYH